jgi:hypothetical protein
MCKKFFVSFLLFCLCVVQALASTHNGLKAAFDDLHFALTVEWDQKDQSFYRQQEEQFALKLKELQSQGLSNRELVNFALAEVKDEQLRRDLEKSFNLIALNALSAQEAQEHVLSVLSKSYSNGASWNGGAAIGAVLFIVIMVAVVLIISGEARIEDGCYQVRRCSDICSAGVCYESCRFECL